MPELIDKQAALDIAMSYCPDDDGCCSKAGHDLREMLDEIEALPNGKQYVLKVEEEGWIPCSDRLPEDRTGIIFTVDRGHPFVCVGYRINGEREGLKLQRWFDKLSGLNFIDYDVKAWMPMPDAYKPPEKE